MSSLKGSKTMNNLKEAFAGESQANRRYLYFAQKADVEGYNDVSAVFRSTAEGETGHAHGHLEYLEAVGDPATGQPIGATDLNGTVNDLATRAQAAFTSAVDSYKQVAKLEPNNTNAQFQLAQAAGTAGDTATEVAAYKAYLKLNPDSSTAAQVRQLIKQLGG